MNNEDASKVLQAIADPNRLAIITLLENKLHVCANEFLDVVNCKQATLSHHLSELGGAGLVNSKRKGNKVYYCLDARKFNQLVNFLGKIDRINKSSESTPKKEVKVEQLNILEQAPQIEQPKPVEEKPIRVVDTPIVNKKPEPVKVELPLHLL